jgi:hypothetical protein
MRLFVYSVGYAVPSSQLCTCFVGCTWERGGYSGTNTHGLGNPSDVRDLGTHPINSRSLGAQRDN